MNAASGGVRSWPVYIMIVLTTINFLNYIDQRLLSAVLESIKAEWTLSDAQGGLLGSVFVIVYTLCAPVGFLGDRMKRKNLIAGGVLLWSLATVAAAFARNYQDLLIARALLGVGEACYATIAPSIIADLYSKDLRSRKLAYFYLATPVGSALGYILGGYIGEFYGWRAVFLVGGLPGLVFALLAFLMVEPERGRNDDQAPASGPALSLMATLRRLIRTPAWRINTIGLALLTFTIGGLALWMPSYLERVHGMSSGQAGTIFGGVTVIAGICGTLLGGRLGDRMQARSPGGFFRLSGIGLLASSPFIVLMTQIGWLPGIFIVVFLAEMLLFLNTGPLNAALIGCVPVQMRGAAFAVNVLCIHAFGDALSNVLLGVLSDAATPILGSPAAGLSLALAATAIPVAVGGVVLLRGARWIARQPDGLMHYPG
ncbi:MAG: MFS transporter [Myxococcales bacterium]|nr:MFS transporter [Myxococcales bacterium]